MRNKSGRIRWAVTIEKKHGRLAGLVVRRSHSVRYNAMVVRGAMVVVRTLRAHQSRANLV